MNISDLPPSTSWVGRYKQLGFQFSRHLPHHPRPPRRRLLDAPASDLVVKF